MSERVSIGRCLECEHWTPCTFEDMAHAYGICEQPAIGDDDPNGEPADDGLLTGSFAPEWGRETIYTGPRFGCVHWEAR